MLIDPTNSIAVEPEAPTDLVTLASLYLRTPARAVHPLFDSRFGRTLISSGFLLAISILGFVVMGYHPGAEDDAVYLTAVKANLNPALFPHDSDFFKLELRETVFDTWMAAFVRSTGIPLAWSELLWQFISIFSILAACWTIIVQIFEEASARWAGVAMVAAMFTLPVAGTALYIVDQYLHPRSLATALILFAISRIIARSTWQALPLLLLACLLHPMMGAFGVSFCCTLALALYEPVHMRIRDLRERMVTGANAPAAAMLPLAWMFDPLPPIWLETIRSRHWFSIYEWTWYEWLGAIGPLAIFWLLAYLARRRVQPTLARVAGAILIYSIFQLAVAMLILGSPALIGLSALEPMRYLHLVYIFLALIAGAYLGKHILKTHIWRWVIFLLVANGGMFITQRQLFAGTEHIEWPGRASANSWVQAFEWIKQNTPKDAYFALDPNYLAARDEDYHSFRALAERSVLADAIKDTSVVTKVPELGPVWERQTNAEVNWDSFTPVNFQDLKAEFGTDWALVRYPQPHGLACLWHNRNVAVCRIP